LTPGATRVRASSPKGQMGPRQQTRCSASSQFSCQRGRRWSVRRTSAVTFDQLATRWLAQAEENLSPTTLRTYKSFSPIDYPDSENARLVASNPLIWTISTENSPRGCNCLRQPFVRCTPSSEGRFVKRFSGLDRGQSGDQRHATASDQADLSPPNPNQVAELLHAAHARDPEVEISSTLPPRPVRGAARSAPLDGATLTRS